MRTGLKIILIVATFMVGGLIIALMKDATGSSGGGPIGLIIAAILFAAIRAIWKYNPSPNSDTEISTDRKQEDEEVWIKPKKDDYPKLDKS